MFFLVFKNYKNFQKPEHSFWNYAKYNLPIKNQELDLMFSELELNSFLHAEELVSLWK